MSKDYPRLHEELQQFIGKLGTDIPTTMSNSGALHKNAMADGALTARMKEPLALASAVAARCDGCVAYHMRDALQTSASRAEITETIRVAALMGGSPALIYGAEAHEAPNQCQNAA
jgi:AhpD family alkylhydroperoxidase